MVERRPARQEAEGTEAEATAEARELDAQLERLPGDLRPLATISDPGVEDLLALAERQVAEARKRLGTQAAKPRLRRVEELFTQHAGRPPRVGEELERAMRSPALVERVAGLDGTFDQSLATAHNLFDRASVRAGSAVQLAYDDWAMSVRIYKSDIRAAGAIMAAEVENARHTAPSDSYDPPMRGETQVEFFARADRVAAALLTYERRIEAAGADLAKAYTELITVLYTATNTLGVAEAALIATTQGANRTFWTSVQHAVAQARN